MKYNKIKIIAKGWSSYIWLAEALSSNSKDSAHMSTGQTVVAIKEVREKSNRKNLYEREGNFLAMANTVGVGPKLIEANKEGNFVVYEFVQGENFLTFANHDGIKKTSKEELYNFIKELIRQVILLDSIGLVHKQLQVGKNILVTKRNGKIFPIIIDFEKASATEKNKKHNYGQVTSFLFYNPNGFVAKEIRKKFGLKL